VHQDSGVFNWDLFNGIKKRFVVSMEPDWNPAQQCGSSLRLWELLKWEVFFV